MKNHCKIFLNCFLLLMLGLSVDAQADCSSNRSPASPYTTTLNPGDIIVQRDTPVGTVIATVTTPSPRTGGVWNNCINGGGTNYYYMSMFPTPSPVSGYYNTNIPGVGVAVGYSTAIPASFRSPANAQFTAASGISNAYPLYLTFVKTGDIVSGRLSSGLLAYAYADGSPSVKGVTVNINGNAITQVACSITTPNLTFPIGDVLASAFGTAVGTIPSGAQNTQNLGLNCDAQANINASLSGTQNPDVGTGSVLALTGQGNSNVAKGVGVQILYNGSPLVLNNRIVLKRSSGGQEALPLTARYYQTKTSVTTGIANASATLNLTYQ